MLVKAIAGIKIMPTFAESKRINEYLITEVCESLTNVPFRHCNHGFLILSDYFLLVCENR